MTARDDSDWQAWNDGTGKRKWFLARSGIGGMEYHWAKPAQERPGALIRYARYETACRAAERLNVKGDAS
jgi:hypothetical protein